MSNFSFMEKILKGVEKKFGYYRQDLINNKNFKSVKLYCQ